MKRNEAMIARLLPLDSVFATCANRALAVSKAMLSVVLLGASALCCPPATPQEDMEATDKRIFQEVRQHNEIMKNLEYLSDTIGPRVTGTDQFRTAVTWASDLSRRYELDNVHLEGWKIAHAWRRGSAQARILSPVSRNLTIASAGWSPSTAGQVRGSLVYVSATKTEELEAYRGKLKGAIVIYEPPASFTSEGPELPGPLVQAPAPPPDRSINSPIAQLNAARLKFFKEQGVAAILRQSDKSYGLFGMSDVRSQYEIGLVPTAMTTHEDYSLIWRLLQKGPVQIQLTLSNSFSEGPVEVDNTVAEIRGLEKPDEVVIICAHLDSWDLGSGSTDDGTGVVAVLEAARAIKALGLRPLRTIRLVLFTGEEQGTIGSREYVKQHRDELKKISAVLVDDTTTTPLITIRLNQNYAARKLVDTVLAPMRELNLIEPRMERSYGSDYASFNDVGVPGFSCIGGKSDYDRTHHSQADTFDKIHAEGVIHAAQVLAGWAYNTAQLPELLPRN